MMQANYAEPEWGEAVTEEFRQQLITRVADQTVLGGGNGGADFDLDDVFIFGNNPDEALGAAMQKQMTAGGIGDQRGRALGLIKAADALAMTDKIPEATAQATEAADICNEMKTPEMQAAAMNVMTKICIKQATTTNDDEDFQLAQESASDTLRLFQKMGYKKGTAVALATFSSVYYAWGKADKCINYAKQALVTFSELGAQECMAEAYHTLCKGYLLDLETKKAVRVINKALKIHEGLGDMSKQAQCMHTIARLEFIGNDTAKAFVAMESAEKMFRQAGDTRGLGEVLDTHIEFCLSQRKYAEAVALAKKKVNAIHDTNDTRAEAYALVQLGQILLTSNQSGRAEKVAEVALGMFAGMNDMDGMKVAKDLLDGSKHAKEVEDITTAVEKNRDYMHVPNDLVIDPGFYTRLVTRYQEAAGK